MCRRWTGGPFATLAWFGRDAVQWTGTAVAFRSSPIAIRTHCGACGTPLSLAYDARDDVALTVHPTHHYGAESRIAWVDIGPALPAKPTREQW